jgi:ABC-2 type transport system ATP-binding protein
MTAITLHHLTKSFGTVTAVKDVSLEAPSGAVTGFLGPNGAGKTTALRMLLGLFEPTSGEALIGGQRYADLAWPRRTVGAVLDAAAVHPGRSGRNHLRVIAAGGGLSTDRVDDLLDMVGLTDAAGRRVGHYSMGMRQRLALAGAMLGDPSVLILDEPANGLDPAGISWLRGVLRDLADQGRTVVVSSHLLAEMTNTVDHVVVLAEGDLRYDGPLEALAAESSLEDAFLRLTTRTVDSGVNTADG